MESYMLSLVIPAYKREKTIVKNLKAIEMVLENQPFKYEIILVDATETPIERPKKTNVHSIQARKKDI